MKFVATAILAATLLLTGCAKIKAGYDVGACAPDGFMAAHVEYVSGVSLTFTDVSTEPNKVFKLKKPTVYAFASKDKNGQHYVSNNIDITIADADSKEIVGTLSRDGQVVARFFGVPGDGTKIIEHANQEVTVCQELIHSDGQAPNADTAQN